ncbi:MAG: SCO family protein [Opitutaceae bacterium]|nr:SCO family protein [Verrucomicrobiales bacterium]
MIKLWNQSTAVLMGCFLAVSTGFAADRFVPGTIAVAGPRVFTVKGVIRTVKSGENTVVIRHEEIPNYMAAMTMPFKVRDARDLAGLKEGDAVSFRLNVTEDEGWIDQIRKSDPVAFAKPYESRGGPPLRPVEMMRVGVGLPDAALTNQLGHAVRFGDFRGKALAVTFFFTRCPMPQYCPQLSKNFREASAQLKATADGPTNWHFLSITFEPSYDTPEVMKEYGGRYQADSNHWSFLTGSPETISLLARQFGITVTPEGGTLNHNFRTVIVNPDGRIRAIWPVVGNMSTNLFVEITKAARGEAVIPAPVSRP